ncbi:MFS transporter [Alkanindiges sp. WGS2144]|uniref:MFS transporter n=1 Tax=Alkanindiges sp. WGS2144 TaxID=3366808 RepID=UPI0037506A4E
MPDPVSNTRIDNKLVDQKHSQNHGLSRSMVMLMAFTTGVVVASNYYAQPLLHSIADYFDLSYSSAGVIVTVAQLAYALGLVLLVPLGDLFEQRRLMVVMLLLSTSGLIISALSLNIWMLFIGTAITSFFSVVAQVIVPFGAALASPQQRGQVVGTIMSGLLLGILLARTVAGFLSEIGDWRSIYWFAAVVILLTTMLLYRTLPQRQQHAGLNYLQLLATIFRFFKTEKIFLWRSVMGGLIFACFGVLWTPLAFLLAEPPYGYSNSIIGLFGLAGVAGALAATSAGKMVDQGRSREATTLGCILLIASWIPVYFGAHSVMALVLGIIVLDLCVQLVHVVNQNIIYQINPEARNRLNAGYMLSYFIGGALGSLISAWMYQHYGWAGVSVMGFVLSSMALAVWLATQRYQQGV